MNVALRWIVLIGGVYSIPILAGRKRVEDVLSLLRLFFYSNVSFPDLFLLLFSFLGVVRESCVKSICIIIQSQVVYSLEGDGDEEEEVPFSITTVGGKGVLRSLAPLDYEQRSWYQLRILAKDHSGAGGKINTATAGLLVRLVDEEDQGPEFITVPSITRIAEDARPGTSILRVKAIDGDRGVNQRIVYSIEPANQYFAIDSKDGTVYLVQELDREDPSVVNGALILSITAEEDSPLRPKVTTEVTILVLDVNDQAPAFRGHQYLAEIDENSPANMPVTFIGPGSVAEVYDYDQVINALDPLNRFQFQNLWLAIAYKASYNELCIHDLTRVNLSFWGGEHDITTLNGEQSKVCKREGFFFFFCFSREKVEIVFIRSPKQQLC